MSQDTKIVLSSPAFRRFDKISNGGQDYTIVKAKKTPISTTYTVKNIKWSKHRIINCLKRLLIIIKYR